ncbi:MAG: hypothetical protein VKI83_05065 [Synechococcaceae cyanobacterium]|nr:hypothetical protein [Synechococcaceae cyanobacterium]
MAIPVAMPPGAARNARSTYVSHNERSPTLSFYDAPLAGIPSLQRLAVQRCCRVIDPEPAPMSSGCRCTAA